MVNGPEDLPRVDLDAVEWDRVDWRVCEREVRRLRQRIFKASREGDLAKVRNLQKLMLRSRSNTLLAVRQVTQRNTGRTTAGIDGEVALTSPARAEMAVRVHASARTWRPVAVKRVHIPKTGSRTKLRPLGIPVIMDRCHQARVRAALEPEWEARFEPKSHGFRPGRGCQDAIQSIYVTCRGPLASRVWALDADLAAAFDRIDHDHLLTALGSFPARAMIRDWLKAGVFEPGKGFAPTEEGTPQGGVISPLLLNVALHGLEEAAGVAYVTSGAHAGETTRGCPVLIRYADDMVALCYSQQQAQQIKARLAEWLKPRGLVFNEDKTRIVSLTEGFDFLGFNIRRYGLKLLIKPSTAAMRRIRRRLADEVRTLRGSNAVALLATLNPIIRGWAAYYRTGVSSRAFSSLDDHMWRLLYKWVTWTHPAKPKRWIVDRYFGRRNKFRNDRWVFGDPETNAAVIKFAWTGIVRHVMVKGAASPDDPDLTDYWARRRQKVKPPLDGYTLRLLTRQGGRCVLCGDHLLTADQPPQSPHQWERWWLQVVRKAIASDYLVHHGRPGPSGDDHTRLVHAACARGLHARQRNPAQHTRSPSRLA
ncbi:reverse transcriptase domain-containing protein [Microtetraspora sp. NBRC 16547]|uniref:reverse transcriptase domain-containing protein n=1 Tax=Microtetraspora sp. NBRC 16547 TaxID=3030993 RepID=UPI0024A2364E|nr:reverse transcriptase domain-containing protein [Microtetraspora sp. NBRC 16547]GLW96455.1 group II intron reverse transcriptase/maturase [Microtetraspora sp. NBRC 16547]